MLEFHAEVKKAIVAKTQSKKDASNNLRRFLISNMKHGRHLVLNLDTMVPTFSDYDLADACPLKDYFFHRANLFEKHKGWLRPDEDKDIQGNPGLFALNPKYNLIILSNMANPDCDDEIIQMVRDEVPHMEDFHKVFIKAEK